MKRLLSFALITALTLPAALPAMASEEDQKTSAASRLQLQKYEARVAQEQERKQAVGDVAVPVAKDEEQDCDNFAFFVGGSNPVDRNSKTYRDGLPTVLAHMVAHYSKVSPEHAYSFKYTLTGHTAIVMAVAFNHNGSRIASASDDKTVKIWDTHTRACLHTLKGHTGCIYSVAFNRDGSRVVSASGDKTVKIWDTHTGTCLRTLKGHERSVLSVAFSPDGSLIVSASFDGTIKIWDAYTGTRKLGNKIHDMIRGGCLRTLRGHDNWVNSARFNYDGSHIISTSYDTTIKIWDTHTGKCLHTLGEDHDNFNDTAVLSHDGEHVVCALDDKTIKLWDVRTGDCLHTLAGHTDIINSVLFSDDDARIISTSNDNTIKIWNAHTGDCLCTLQGHTGPVSSVTLSRDGAHLVSASGDCTIKVWHVARCPHELIMRAIKARDAHLQADAIQRVLDADADKVDEIIEHEKKKRASQADH